MKSEFKNGLQDGIPIALGYLSVSFSIGIMAQAAGLTTFQGALLSISNMTSAGEFAGLRIMAAGGTILEIIATLFIINLRYALMSLSLSQKLSEEVTLRQRFLIAFANTDEIFAVAMAHGKSLTLPYMAGLEALPIVGWTTGTILGSVACELMPAAIAAAMGVALYGMFIAIVIPVARKSKPVLIVAAIAILISSLLYYVPAFSGVSDGISIILSTVIAAALGAILFPVKDEAEEELPEESECRMSEIPENKGQQ